MKDFEPLRYVGVIKEICDLRWNDLGQRELTNVAWAYYHFSI